MESKADLDPAVSNGKGYVKAICVVESSDGHKSDLVIFRPSSEKLHDQTPILIVHPALGAMGSYYYKFAESLVSQMEWVVVVQEQRGQGSSSWRASAKQDWSFWDPIEHDYHLHLAIIRQSFANNPIFVLGHSVGGLLWTLWLAKQKIEKNDQNFDQIRGFISIAMGSIHHKIHPSRGILPFGFLVSSLSHILGWWPGTRFGFGADTEAKSFMLDWAHTIWHGNWQPKGCPYPNITETFREIRKPSLFITIDSDAFTPPVCTAQLAAQFDPQYTSLIVLKASAEPDLKDMTGEQVHLRWARTNVMQPLISAFVRRHQANAPSNSTMMAKL